MEWRLIEVVEIVAPLSWFCCFVVVVVKMFLDGAKGPGIVCIVLAACGIGFLINSFGPINSGAGGMGRVFAACTSVLFFVIAGGIAFIWGWSKRSIRYVMLVWTGCVLVPLLIIFMT